ncbi:type IV toxin-antitoxin system AbiEi family antitoxin [uncultured Zhongshania sp.]|jgi:hypothetical protein|uniref:type IV toxin-antitoxin system AbiEi family antitoxin n=1 Tax=uncultured Zhongshania sp. TaxID=1642288 RepID=UPI0025D1FC90|nr:type IV toxin-antitoxin system AbiEi family antitoxin [uncultured Zhongshania sp.]|tara:strand:+ start:4556 stop:5623 length:1068 start_codon:yes stop_codon:yes gene_type:complete
MDITIENKTEQLLANALRAFKKETGLKIELTKARHHENDKQTGDEITLPFNAGTLPITVKKWVQNTNVGVIAHQMAQLAPNTLLIADYINPNMAIKFREQNIQFIDTAGNAYIHQPPIHTWVTANKITNANVATTEKTHRAFDTAGLKVVFALLCEPALADNTYRQIADQTGVALGTVGQVFDGLKAAGYLLDQGKTRKRRLMNSTKLLERWVEAYPEKLKPKLFFGEFIAPRHDWWTTIKIEDFGAYWGGEIAAEKYTNYLNPKVATVYLPEEAGTLLLGKARLRRRLKNEYDPENVVQIYRPFWPEQYLPDARPGLAHPILVYADLIHTGDVRNRETAGKLYEQYIIGYLKED